MSSPELETRIEKASRIVGKALARLARQDPDMAREMCAALTDAVDAMRTRSQTRTMYDRSGAPVSVTVPTDPPRTIVDGEEVFYATGKHGVHVPTGQPSSEYEADNGCRLWASSSGTILTRNA